MGKLMHLTVAVALLCSALIDCVAQVNSVVIPVQFSDVKFSQEDIKGSIYNLFNGINYHQNNATGSVVEYFKDNLGQNGYFAFHVIDPVTVSKTKAYYGANSDAVADAAIASLVFDACTEASHVGTDFSRFDADRDGIVDHVYIFFAGYNESESGRADDILPQTWDVSDKPYVFNGKKIAKFSCCSEYRGSKGREFSPVGTICHELCHFLGLMDMYDVNGVVEGLGDGLYGTLSVMDKGNYNNGGCTPPYMNAVELETVGLLRKIPAARGLTYELYPLHQSHEALVIETSVPGEYYLVEYRAGEKWDAYMGGRGALVYHIDRSSLPAGSMPAAMRWKINAVNACASHPCMALVDAFGAGEASGVFYPGDRQYVKIDSYETIPLMLWNGNGSGIGLSISYNARGNISVSVDSDKGWNIPHAVDCSVIANQTDATITWGASREGDAVWTISWGPTSSVLKETIITSSSAYTFTSLIPGETYECIIFVKDGDMEGRHVSLEFTTIPQLNQFPLIAEMDRQYVAGDRLRLHLLNTGGNRKEVWFINGNRFDGEYYTFPAAGTYAIRVETEDEILEKRIVVNEK